MLSLIMIIKAMAQVERPAQSCVFFVFINYRNTHNRVCIQ